MSMLVYAYLIKKQTNLTNEEVTTLALESHNNSVVMGSQEQTPHLKDAVSASSQLTALLNAVLAQWASFFK